MRKAGLVILALLLVMWGGASFLLSHMDSQKINMEEATPAVLQVTGEETTAAKIEPGASLTVEAKSAVLMDPQTGEILWEQNQHERYYPASMTKLMTMVIAMDMVAAGQAELTENVVTSERAESFGGSEVFLETGETFSLEEMLIAIAVVSANDAAVAVAEHLAGSEEAFVTLMNEKAKELGLSNTNFTNCHGLHDPENYTSAHDMAVIARYALKYPEIRQWTSIKQYTFREEPLSILDNTNKMLYWYPGTDGFKTGFTDAAGLNLVSTVEKDNFRLIAVVMGVEIPRGNFTESMKIYNYAYKQWAFHTLYEAGDIIYTVPVGKGKSERVELVAEKRIGARVSRIKSNQEKVTARAEIPNMVDAPVKKGQKVGEVIVSREGQDIERVNLLAKDDIPKAGAGQIIARTFRSVFTVRQ